MSRRGGFLMGVLGSVEAAAEGTLLNTESFAANFGLWTTPGNELPEDAWLRISGASPSATTGPDGGSDPATRDVTPANSYAYTEASDAASPWSLESPKLDASLGLSTLSFDRFMRFGSLGGIIDGTLEVQGWNGSAWSRIGQPFTGSEQTSATDDWLGSDNSYNSLGFTNGDFRFRFLFTKGVSEFNSNYDAAVDNIAIIGPVNALVGGEVDPPADARAAGFNTGLRRLHVSKTSTPPIDGTTIAGGLTFTSIQAALNAALAGDVITVAADRYQETPNGPGANGTVANPIWIAAEVAGGAVIDNYVQSAFNGTASWQNDGGGVFSIPGSRPYVGYDNVSKEFLPGFRSVADITAATIPTVLGPNSPSGSISKPSRGFGFSGGRISVRLSGGTNPNGRSVALTDGFNTTLWDINADNVILDGFLFAGAGDAASVGIGTGAANCTVQNCVFESCQFGVRIGPNGVLLKRDEFTMVGLAEWQQALAASNGATVNALFKYAKNYYTASLVGGNDNDALLEGGLDVSVFGDTASNIRITECLMQECFEGSKAGRHRDVEMDLCVFDRCFDDAVELETASSGQGVSGAFDLHDCLIQDCFVSVSHQGDVVHADHFVYRNVMIITGDTIIHPPNFLKMIKTPATVDVHYYHNLFINRSTTGNDGFGSAKSIWYPFSAPNGDADKIKDWRNNAVFVAALTTASTNPSGRTDNVVASPSNNSQSQTVQGTGGVFAGTSEASLGLGANFQLNGGSPCIGAGDPLSGGLPDSRSGTGVNDDAGPFPNGENPGPDWPRSATREFTLTLPDRWTSPGN